MRRKFTPPESPPYKFRAKSIPRACTVPLFHTLEQEKENSRRERVAINAQKALRESSLPPRMKMYEESNAFKKKLVVDELPVNQYR